jgi:hypothetical protein
LLHVIPNQTVKLKKHSLKSELRNAAAIYPGDVAAGGVILKFGALVAPPFEFSKGKHLTSYTRMRTKIR